MIGELHPNLVLLDITMPTINGFEVLEQITKEFPQTRVIILTVHDGTEYAMRALRAGAAGYLHKSATSIELEVAISAVARGGTYLSHEISQKTLFEYAQAGTPQDLLASLTTRQRE